MTTQIFLLLSFFIFIRLVSSQGVDLNWKTFDDLDGNPLVYVTVHNVTGDVYIAASNVIYHLDADLVLKKKVVTGPQLVCETPGPTCDGDPIMKSNSPQSFHIVYHLEPPMLMMCSTLYDGTCQLRPLHDLDQVFWIGPSNEGVARVTKQRTDSAFFGPGIGNQLVFYSGANTNPLKDLKDDPRPFFSSKVLVHENDQYIFKYSYHSNTTMSAFFFKPIMQITTYSFVYKTHVYFLFVRAHNRTLSTVLARVCIEDGSFQSYVEQRISCRVGRTRFTLSTTAFLGPAPEHEHQESLPKLQHLYMAFGGGNQATVICGMQMELLNVFFKVAAEDCFQGGEGESLLNLNNGGSTPCNAKTNVESSDFCGPNINPYIVNELEPVVKPYIMFPHPSYSITALFIFEQNKKIVGFVGTDNGGYVKVRIDKPKNVLHIGTTYIGTTQNSLAFDLKQEHVYFIVGDKVVKYPIGLCSLYKTCLECFSANFDPLGCGWCDGRCAQRRECVNSESFSLSCTPSIHSVEPLIGPTQGGTHLTIIGNNFGTQGVDTVNSVKVADAECSTLSWANERILCRIQPSLIATSGPIRVTVKDGSNPDLPFVYDGFALSDENFTFVTPKLMGIYPGRGSILGGTNVTLYGEHLDIGKEHTVNIHRRYCKHLQVGKSTATCITGTKVNLSLRDTIEMKIDDIVIEIDRVARLVSPLSANTSEDFKYLEDPKIYRIHPPSTFLSFTGNLTITGSHLDNAIEHRMLMTVLADKALEFEEPCWLNPDSDGTLMMCSMPALMDKNITFPTSAVTYAHVLFIMDGSRKNPRLRLYALYPEPKFELFQEVQELPKNQTFLEIKGEYLGSESEAEIVNVKIGENSMCNISEFTLDTLRCALPSDLMTNASVWGKNLSVQVFTGSRYYHLGYLTVSKEEMEPVIENWNIALVGTGIIILCLFAVIGFWCFCRKRRQNKLPANASSSKGVSDVMFKADYKPIELSDHEEETITGEGTAIVILPASPTVDLTNASPISPPVYANIESTIVNPHQEMVQVHSDHAKRLNETLQLLTLDGLIIQREHLILDGVIGAGQFSSVFKAVYHSPEEGDIEVAVKKIRQDSEITEQSVMEFLDEGSKMKDFHHEHVLELIGICFENRIPMIVVPFMHNGDLCSFLRNDENIIYVEGLLKFANQVAAGMAYLAKEKFVHRDLAARNCLIDSEETVKVADFGLSRDIYERDYYQGENKRKLPYRWMSPECIELDKYTEKSDVWSYGITMWEIMTRSVSPYEKIDDWALIEYLKAGMRLPRPLHCSRNLYKVMRSCWESDPSKRPNFDELHAIVNDLWTSTANTDRMQSVPPHNSEYANSDEE